MDEVEAQRLQQQLQRLHRRQRSETPAVPGVSRTASRMLGVVARGAPDGVQPGDIGAELGMAASNVAAGLRELDGAGLVVRRRADDDRRCVLVSLTPDGRTAVAAFRAGRAGWLLGAVTEALTPDEQAVLLRAGDLLDRVSGHAGAGGGRPS